MRRSRFVVNAALSAAAVAAAPARAVFAQAGRIPPEYIEDWFSNRASYAAVFGVLAGVLVALAWLPRLLPAPHANDVGRARRRFYFGLLLSTLILWALLLLDVSMNYRFGTRSYNFSEYLFQVWLTWRSFVLLLLGALCFTLVVALVARAGSRFYRYMLIPR
jgi:hypothetical protein